MLYLPPTIEVLKSVFPSVIPIPVNRSHPRCVQCDKVNAERAAYFAEFPPPEHDNPIVALERHITKIENLIAEGIMVEGLGAALAVAKQQKSELEQRRDDGIRKSWEAFWGVWGVPK